MCRLATAFAGGEPELEDAARAAPQINNDTASIADADANRLMNPASLKTRGSQANAPDYAWAMWGKRLVLPGFSARWKLSRQLLIS
jgi:hypothetical protein